MARYVVAVVRTTYYRVEAATPAEAWDAYLDAPYVSEKDEVTEGHYILAADEDDDPTGPVLESDGELVPPVDSDDDACPKCGMTTDERESARLAAED